MNKLIITVAQTGGFHGKAENPALPEQPDEIAQSAYECWNAGASVIHVHAREKDGKSSARAEVFREINQKIRQKCPDVIIQGSTGGGPGMTFEQRTNSLNAEPEMTSFNMGLLAVVWKGQEALFSNLPSELERVAKVCMEKNIKPEMEVYNLSMLDNVKALIKKGLLTKPYVINFVMGMGAIAIPCQDFSPKNLLLSIEHLPPDSIFNVCAIARSQLPATTLSTILGGNLRVGFEDNIQYMKGQLAKSNAQLVERAVRIAKELGRPIASPSEAREMLGVPKTPRVWN